MAQNNLAYWQQEEREQGYDAQPIPSPRPKLRTVQGRARATSTQPRLAPWAHTLVIMSAVFIVVLATVSVARVSIANATVQMMQTAEQTSANIDSARAVGLELEVKHSLANNPTRIQDRAAEMGILPAHQPATIEAHTGFSPETTSGMQLAAEEARATELALLQGPAEESAATETTPEPSNALEPTAAAQALFPSASEA